MSSETRTDGRCNAKTRDGGFCENYPKGDSERCRMHGADSDGGAPEGNDNAVDAAAWADDFYQDFLTEQEQRRVREATDVLGSKAGAQEIGRHVASLALEQFRRTGDERFLRRFESICDKFSIAPAEELDVTGDVEINHEVDEDTKEMLSELFDRDVQNS